MTDLKDDELPALPEPQRGASYHFTFVYPISDVKKIQREAIAHGVAMERARVVELLPDEIDDAWAASSEGETVVMHEFAEKIIAKYEAKRRGGV